MHCTFFFKKKKKSFTFIYILCLHPQDEFIDKIELLATSYVDAICFHTNKGNVSDWFGNRDAGQSHGVKVQTRKIEANGKGLVALSGRTGSWVDNVVFYFA